MQYFPKISVIIPNSHELNDLNLIVQAVCNQTLKPFEIVLVDSSIRDINLFAEIDYLCSKYVIRLVYEHLDHAFPGAARNIGLKLATGDFIAFIDVQTIPRPYWLEVSTSALIDEKELHGVWGATCFKAQTRFEKIVRDGFYGVLPRRTLPGSIFRSEIFGNSGRFVEWVRAGEDTEWMLRIEVLKISIEYSPIVLSDYVGLKGSNIKGLLKKWFRNYEASRELPHFFPQKILLWLILYPLLILIAFNWNYLIADWRMDSPFYIGHITKAAVILPALIYIVVRGIVLPYKRGVDISNILPIRFLSLTAVCFLADFVKISVFSLPVRKFNRKKM